MDLLREKNLLVAQLQVENEDLTRKHAEQSAEIARLQQALSDTETEAFDQIRELKRKVQEQEAYGAPDSLRPPPKFPPPV